MSEWTKVVTNPWGLAGFALFVVFKYLAKAKSSDERSWIAPVAVSLAATALIGGLAIAYVQVRKAAQQFAPARQQSNQQVPQTSSGEGSPNVQGVQGDVTITVDQSSGKTETKKPPEKKPKQSSQ